MSKYRITIEGKTYEMEIELVDEGAPAAPAARTPYREFRSAGKDPVVRVIDPSAQKQTVSSSGSVASPMPGTVIRLMKKEGDTVKAGEIVLILEAMKMENEITAPSDGVIRSINCREGGTVAGGEILFEVG